MKKKYYIQAFMLGVGLIFSACGKNSTENINESITEEQLGQNIAPTVSDETVENPFINYNPEQKIYFSCKNINMDIYMEGGLPVWEFVILSLEPLNEDEISISIPIETDYAVEITEMATTRTTDYLESMNDNSNKSYNGLPYYLYQCYRNTDWKKMYQLYEAAEEAEDCLQRISSNSLEYQELLDVIDEYYSYRDLYLSDYQSLKAEDLPKFYVYNVYIWLGATKIAPEAGDESVSQNKISESFQEIDIQIGNEVYTQNIGEIRLHTEYLSNEYGEVLGNVLRSASGESSYPYGDGMVDALIWTFTTKKDVTITDAYLLDEENLDIELLGTHVFLNGNTTIDFYWDLNSVLEIEEGTEVSIVGIWKDEYLMELEYGTRVYPVLKLESDGEKYTVTVERSMERNIAADKIWLYYAIVFDGLDVESYFDDYYRPVYETWREEWG